MKKKEQLAHDFVKTVFNQYPLSTVISADIMEISYQDLVETRLRAFVAGFEKARELALGIWLDKERHVYNTSYYDVVELVTWMGEETCE